MRNFTIIKRVCALTLMVASLVVMLAVFAAPALAADPSISAKWGAYYGPWPIEVVITDCTRLNLRTTAQLGVTWNIAAYPPKGTRMQAIGRVDNFVMVIYNGQTLFGYAAYLTPTRELPWIDPPGLKPITPTVPVIPSAPKPPYYSPYNPPYYKPPYYSPYNPSYTPPWWVYR